MKDCVYAATPPSKLSGPARLEVPESTLMDRRCFDAAVGEGTTVRVSKLNWMFPRERYTCQNKKNIQCVDKEIPSSQLDRWVANHRPSRLLQDPPPPARLHPRSTKKGGSTPACGASRSRTRTSFSTSKRRRMHGRTLLLASERSTAGMNTVSARLAFLACAAARFSSHCPVSSSCLLYTSPSPRDRG